MECGNYLIYFGVELGAAGLVAGLVAGRRTAALGADGVVFAAGGGAATPETALYASITGLVIFTESAAQSTGLCCCETSITTAYPFC